MITNALLDILLAFMTTVRSWMPPWDMTLPNDKIYDIKYELSRWDAILPIHELFQIITMVFTLWSVLLGYRAVKWIIEQIIAVIP